MKKIYILTFLIFTSLTQAQDWTVGEKTVTGVFTSTKSKSELFALINKWISINYNSAQSVIQMNDPESGTIIIKGINEVTYMNKPGRVLVPNSKVVPDELTTKFNHTIEINVKDKKFRIIYTLTDIISPDSTAEAFDKLFFNVINFSGDNSVALQTYTDTMEKFLKQGMIGKEKRERWKSATTETFKEVNEKLESNLKATMLTIENSTGADDKW
jgi:hypothetical protein